MDGWRRGDASLLPDMVWSQPSAREMMEREMGYPFGKPELARSAVVSLESPLPTRNPVGCEGLTLPEPRLPEPIVTPMPAVARLQPMVTPEVRGPSVRELRERFERPPVVSGSMDGFTIHPSVSRGPVTLTADRIYEDAPYHTTRLRPGKSEAPINGQELLDKSIPVKDTSTRRVAVVGEDKFVVFDEHRPGKYHGHVMSWEELRQEAKNALIRTDKVTPKGKVKE